MFLQSEQSEPGLTEGEGEGEGEGKSKGEDTGCCATMIMVEFVFIEATCDIVPSQQSEPGIITEAESESEAKGTSERLCFTMMGVCEFVD